MGSVLIMFHAGLISSTVVLTSVTTSAALAAACGGPADVAAALCALVRPRARHQNFLLGIGGLGFRV